MLLRGCHIHKVCAEIVQRMRALISDSSATVLRGGSLRTDEGSVLSLRVPSCGTMSNSAAAFAASFLRVHVWQVVGLIVYYSFLDSASVIGTTGGNTVVGFQIV
jgi:hypothetical protein